MGWIWAVILSMIVLVYLKQGPKNKKRMPPGPKALPIIGHLHLLRENPHKDLRNLARKHGPIMGLRLGFAPVVVFSSPAAAELVLKTHDLIFCSRPRHEAARYISYDQRNLLSSPYGSYWRNMRKLCTLNLLSSSKINEFQPMRKAELHLCVDSLRKAAGAGEAVNLSTTVSELVGDMNCRMVYGRKQSDMEKCLDAIEEGMEVFGKFYVADYFPYIGWLDLHGMNRKMKRLSRIADEVLEEIIDEHAQKKEEREHTRDFVDTIMAIMESGEAGFDFDRRHVKAVLLDLFVGGLDTASTSIVWVLSELMRHPTVMKKLQQELEQVVGLDKMVEESHLDKLEYLDCVVKESMRLHPVAMLMIHESMEDCDLEGYYIPKGSRIVVNAYAIGRDPEAWPDPESFTPERFVGSEIDVKGRHFQLLPFGSGRRGCPGMQLGLTVVKVVVAQLMHCFDWEVPGGEVDMTEHFGMVTSKAKSLMAIPIFRLH